MAALVTNVTTIITEALSWLSLTVTEVMKAGNVLILFVLLVPMIGVGIGLLKRFVK